jgi:hypothetical protein
VTAQLDLFSQQLLAGAAILGVLVGKAHAVATCEFSGGFQGGTGHDKTSILVDLDRRRFAVRRSDTASPKERLRNRRSGVTRDKLHTGLAFPRGARAGRRNRKETIQLLLISALSAL